MKKIYIGSDHAGYHLKEQLKRYFVKEQIEFEDLGNLHYDKNDDYSDFAELVATKVARTKTQGILICGSSHGICIAANKFKGIRAVSVSDEVDARYTRKDNDANIICLSGGKTVAGGQKGLSLAKAKGILDVWLYTTASKVARHQRRLKKIVKIEKNNLK